MENHSNGSNNARTLLRMLYYYAKFLGIVNGRFDQEQVKFRRVQRSSKCIARTIRIVLILIYVGALQKLYRPIESSTGSLIGILTILEMVSVMIFAIFVFIVQTRSEEQIIEIVNRFMKLFQRVAARRKIDAMQMFNRKFVTMLVLKLSTTLLGYLYEMPSLLETDEKVKYNFMHWISSFVGVYLWMGSMFVLDICVLALGIIALMYAEMGNFLQIMLIKMKTLEEDELDEMDEMKMRRDRLSKHRRMKLLCDYADIITDCDAIYAELYALAKQFQRLFQWQIFYYIYYNFMVVLLLFYNCIWIYLHNDHIEKLALLMVFVKIGNLVLLNMCADFVVQRSQIPQLLCLDIVCSDIDERWCMSAESFLNRRQIERLEIKVLGFFQLNNEFILLILSAIVSYLFIIIQFGLSDKLTDQAN